MTTRQQILSPAMRKANKARLVLENTECRYCATVVPHLERPEGHQPNCISIQGIRELRSLGRVI